MMMMLEFCVMDLSIHLGMRSRTTKDLIDDDSLLRPVEHEMNLW